MSKNIKTKLLSLVILLTWGAKAQHSEEYTKYKNQYPDESYIRIQDNKHIDISIDDDEIVILQEVDETDMYLSDAASQGSKESISFSYFFELESIEASALNFKDGKYREEPVKDFKYKDQLDQSFYDDATTVNFIYNNLKKGSKTQLNYVEKIKNPRFLSPFYFGSFYPVLNRKVTIEADNDIELRFIALNTEGFDIKFSKDVKRKTTIYNWQLNNIQPFEYESDAPFKKILPHIVPIISSYNIDGKKVAVLEDLSSLYQWYASLVKDVNSQPTSPELVAIVKELTASLTTDFEKVKAIYYWTQKNIKYIDFEYALGGFIPREANDVFVKKYGDCKDNSSILKEMLEIAGIKGKLTWIGTRSIPYEYDKVPTPIVDNHMILSYKDEPTNTIYYLDATGRYTPIELPTSFIQGKEALIENDLQNFEIQKVPVVAASSNQVQDKTTITINDNSIAGTSKVNFSGYVKSNLFRNLEYLSTDTKLKEYYNNQLQKGSNKFIISTIEENNKYDYDKNFEVNYTFTVDDHIKVLGDEMYVNLNLNKPASYFKTEKDRKYEIEFDYKNEHHYQTKLIVPEGYKVDYLPENKEASNEFITARIKYTLEGNAIIYEHDVISNIISLDVPHQKQVNDLIESIEKEYNEVIVFKKIIP